MKRAQTATEYLIILAVVIIIAIIVVGVLGGIPNIGGRTSERGSQAQLQGLDIGIVSQLVSDQNINIGLRNNRGNTVEIMNITDIDGFIDCSSIVSPTNRVIITPGTTERFICNVSGLNVGARYEIDLSIIYNDRVTNVQFTQPAAKITGTVGSS